MKKVFTGVMLLAILIGIASFVWGCGTQRTTKIREMLTLAERTAGKNKLTVQVMPEGTPLDITSTQITKTSRGLAVAKAMQALASYPLAQAQALGYNFPISTVWQPEAFTKQVVDGKVWWIALLGYHPQNQAAYNETGGICPGIVRVDANDPNKPAEVLLTHPDGKTPYKIKFHYRNQNYSDGYIYRYLYDTVGYNVTDSTPFDQLGIDQQPEQYLDDVTPEVEDGTWKVYFTGTFNVCQQREGSTGAWRFPDIKEFFMVDGETGAVNKMAPDKAPAWVDRIYSPHVMVEYINAWGYNLDNWGKTSERGKMVLDQGNLEEVLDQSGNVIEYVGVMTSPFADDSALGVIIVPTRTLKARFYPMYGPHAISTQYHVTQVINKALAWRGYYVEDLTLHLLYGQPTWIGSLVAEVNFEEQDEQGQNVGSDNGTKGSTYAGCVLIQATDDINIDDVVWDESMEVAFDKYEQHTFQHQTAHLGSVALQEMEGDGTVDMFRTLDEHGDSMYVFTLKEPAYKGLLFRLAPRSTYDRENIDILGTQSGDHVTFKYGDDKTSPTCFAKNLRNLTHPQGGGTFR